MARHQCHGVQATSLGQCSADVSFNGSYSGGGMADFVFKIRKHIASFLLSPVLNAIILYLGVLYWAL